MLAQEPDAKTESTSFSVRNVYSHEQDGRPRPASPRRTARGRPHDFSASATLEGANEVDLTGQGIHDPFLGTSHVGILNSPETWRQRACVTALLPPHLHCSFSRPLSVRCSLVKGVSRSTERQPTGCDR